MGGAVRLVTSGMILSRSRTTKSRSCSHCARAVAADSAVGAATGSASQRVCNVAIGPTSALGPVRVAQIVARYWGLTLASRAMASSEALSRPRAARFLKRHAARK